MQVSFATKYKPSTEEWVVIVRDSLGNRLESRCYYTNDKQDAKDTMRLMIAEQIRLEQKEGNK